jgi:hypothetical protein
MALVFFFVMRLMTLQREGEAVLTSLFFSSERRWKERRAKIEAKRGDPCSSLGASVFGFCF